MLLGDVQRENSRVVAKAVHRGRVRSRTVLPHPGRSRGRVAGEVDPRDGDAFPVRRLRRQPSVADRRDAEVGQVAERNAEARRRDDVVALEDELAVPRRAAHVDAIAVGVTLDPLDRCVDDVAPGTSANVLVERLQVPKAQRREREHRRVHRPRRREHDLPRPRQEALRDLEARVPLPDDEDALAFVARGHLRVRVVRRILEARDRRLPRIGRAESEHARPAAIVPVRRRERELPVLLRASTATRTRSGRGRRRAWRTRPARTPSRGAPADRTRGP